MNRIEQAMYFSDAQRTSLKGALLKLFFSYKMVKLGKNLNEEPSISESDLRTPAICLFFTAGAFV